MSNPRILKTHSWLALALMSPGIAVWGADMASEQSPGTLEEIVVTAQKRAQSIQDVGISVTALSGEDLHRFGFSDSMDIAQQVPSMQFQSTTTFVTPNLRGVSQTEFTDDHELPVGIVVDGVYISSPGAVSTQLFDLERVEVLRGPQGTLFGRNSTGGLIDFVSQKPTGDFSGYTKVGFGSYAEKRFEGVVNGPLINNALDGRLSVATDDHDGYLVNRLGGPNSLSARVYSARGQLLYKPTSDLSILTKLQTSINDHEANGEYAWDPAAPGPNGLGVRIGANQNPFGSCNGCDLLGYRNPDSNPYHQIWTVPGFFDRRAYEASVTVDWNTSAGTFTSVTDFYSHTKRYAEETEPAPSPLFVYSTTDSLDQFSQEFRLSSRSDRLFWVTGLYFLDINNHSYQGLGFNFDPGSQIPGASASGYVDRFDRTNSWAAFGQVELPLAAQWQLVSGLRWTHDKKTLNVDSVNPFGLPAGEIQYLNSSTLGSLDTQTFGMWQGKLQLEWRPQADALIYAGISRGAKSGGFQGNVWVPPSDLIYKPEVLIDYEGGFKLSLAENRVRLDGAVFYYDYRNYQAFQFNQQALSTTVRNVPAVVKGAEFEFEARPLPPLELSLGVSLLDAIAEGVTLPDGTLADRKLPQSPGASFNGLARYTIPIGSWKIALQLDFKYNESFYFTVNNAPVEKESPYGIYNAHVELKPHDASWEVSVFVKNFSNTYYRAYALDVSGLGFSNDRPGVPRWFGIDLRYHFGAH